MIHSSFTEAKNGSKVATSDETLKQIRKELNIKTNDPVKIVNELKSVTGATFESEALQHHMVIDKIGSNLVLKELNDNFKPVGPGVINKKLDYSKDWFSGSNINEITGQWNNEFSNKVIGGCHGMTFFECTCGRHNLEREKRVFKGFDFHMRDFENERDALSYFDINEALKTYNCFGCVINTDYSSGPGIHWVSIFIDCTKELCSFEYFDSGGGTILPEILKFFKKLKSQLKKNSIIIHVSNRIQQRDNHSCGPYSLYYLRSRLEGVPWMYFRDFEIKDDKMHDFRKQLFRIM